jgi:CO/xanthine dehydrogenase Mo-binding subunit
MAKGAMTLKDGHVEQRNFDGYTPPYIADAPVTVTSSRAMRPRQASENASSP